jgi:hypothetical protein
VHELVFSDEEYVPAGHGTHDAEPGSDLYEPVGHGVHVDVPVYPGSHRHEEAEEVPGPDDELVVQGSHRVEFGDATRAEKVLFGQRIHGVAPGTSLYDPAGHAEQVGARPVYPGLHTHSSNLVLAMPEVQLFALQLRHAENDVAARTGWYVPAGHVRHRDEPGTSL